MPLATRGFHFVDGHPFADGGVSDPIPIQRALQDGATEITLVLPHKSNFRLKPTPRWLGKLAYPEFPAVARTWTTRQCVNYNAALDLIKEPPEGVHILVFRPIRPLPVGPFTIAQKRIDAALASGHDEALRQIPVLASSLEPQLPGNSGPA
jgi:predicted patatin/cPLA2 family phospholipase